MDRPGSPYSQDSAQQCEDDTAAKHQAHGRCPLPRIVIQLVAELTDSIGQIALPWIALPGIGLSEIALPRIGLPEIVFTENAGASIALPRNIVIGIVIGQCLYFLFNTSCELGRAQVSISFQCWKHQHKWPQEGKY